MRKITTIAAALLITASVWAQAPEKMSYQAVVRDASNALVATQSVGMQISILQGSPSGTAVYVETQTPNTNANGLVSLEIGNGTVVSGTFATIDWANGPYFIQTETDPTGGTTYTITGTSQLMSVPYALHAKTADTFTGAITEADPVFGASPANGISSSDITNWDNKLTTEVDGSVTNELQDISLSGSNLSLSNGSTVDLSGISSGGGDFNNLTNVPANLDLDYTDDFDGQYSSLTGTPTNVSDFTNDAGYLTSFTESDPTFTASPSAGITNTLINNWSVAYTWGNHANAGYLTSFTEVDGSVTNEIQTLSKTLDIVSLSNTGGSFSVNDADADPLNELQDISLSGSDLSLSNGSTIDLSGVGFDGQYNSLTGVPTNVSDFTNDAGYLTSFSETDPTFTASPAAGITNTLMNNWSIAYTWGNHANAGYLTSEVDGSVTNEIQTLSVNGNDLTISGTGGNTVTLPAPAEPTYTIGMNADMGGYIFYVTPDGKHGLVAATQDQSTTSTWYSAKDAVNNPANHNADGKKFLDWRLPSDWEMGWLFMARASIGGFTSTPTSYYWSGIEDDATRSWAFLFDPNSPGSSNVTKTATIYVRAVRSF